MIVGKTGSGKSVSWQTLQKVLSTMKKDGVAGFNLVKVRANRLQLKHDHSFNFYCDCIPTFHFSRMMSSMLTVLRIHRIWLFTCLCVCKYTHSRTCHMK